MQAVADMYVQTLNAQTICCEQLRCDAVQGGLAGRVLTILGYCGEPKHKLVTVLEPVQKAEKATFRYRS